MCKNMIYISTYHNPYVTRQYHPLYTKPPGCSGTGEPAVSFQKSCLPVVKPPKPKKCQGGVWRSKWRSIKITKWHIISEASETVEPKNISTKFIPSGKSSPVSLWKKLLPLKQITNHKVVFIWLILCMRRNSRKFHKSIPSKNLHPKYNQYSTLSPKVPLQGIRTHAVATNGEIP